MYKGLAVANTTFAAEGEADSLSDPSDIKYLGDNCVGVNLHHNASFSQDSDVVSSASITEAAWWKGDLADATKGRKAHLVVNVKVWHLDEGPEGSDDKLQRGE